jgi:hypothetical protein
MKFRLHWNYWDLHYRKFGTEFGISILILGPLHISWRTGNANHQQLLSTPQRRR